MWLAAWRSTVRMIAEYSLRSPLYVFRQYGRQNYEMIKVPNLPAAISAAPSARPRRSLYRPSLRSTASCLCPRRHRASSGPVTPCACSPSSMHRRLSSRRRWKSVARQPVACSARSPPQLHPRRGVAPTERFRIDPDDEPLAPAPIRVGELNAVRLARGPRARRIHTAYRRPSPGGIVIRARPHHGSPRDF